MDERLWRLPGMTRWLKYNEAPSEEEIDAYRKIPSWDLGFDEERGCVVITTSGGLPVGSISRADSIEMAMTVLGWKPPEPQKEALEDMCGGCGAVYLVKDGHECPANQLSEP